MLRLTLGVGIPLVNRLILWVLNFRQMVNNKHSSSEDNGSSSQEVGESSENTGGSSENKLLEVRLTYSGGSKIFQRKSERGRNLLFGQYLPEIK